MNTTDNLTIEILKEEKLESYSGGGLKEVVAIIKKGDERVGSIDNYLQLGYKPYIYPEATGAVTTKFYYSTIDDAFKAAKEIDLFK